MKKIIIHIFGGSPKKKGSIEEYYFELTRQLNNKGYKTVFIFDREITPQLEYLYNQINAEIIILPNVKGRIDFQFIKSFRTLVKKLDPAIVNVVFGNTGFNAIVASHLAGIHNTVWTRGSFNEYGPFYCKVSFFKRVCSIIFCTGLLAKRIIAVSKGLKKEMLMYYLPDSKIKQIYRGINLKRFSPKFDFNVIYNEFGLKEGDRVASVVSQARPEKGLEYLIEAIPIITKKYDNFKLLIIGGGPLTNSLKQLCAQLNIEKNVVFCGVRNDVEQIMSISEFSFLPSFTEGLPLVSLESIASGKPVVATNVGGIPEVIQNGVTGFLVPPKDSYALAEKALQLLSNKELLIKMKKFCIAKAAQFDVKQGAAKTVELYEEIING